MVGGGGGGVDQALIPQKNAYLHIDVFRIDQVVRNMITNAVCMYENALLKLLW